jgi:hypothetical protein
MADSIPATETLPLLLTEIQVGDGLGLAAAGRLFPAHRGTGTINPATVFRWVTKGTRTTSGQVVKLEAVRTPGRWLTSRGAVARFVTALTSAADLSPNSIPPRSPGARNKAAESASLELTKLGA